MNTNKANRQSISSRTVATKALIIQEFKRRLKDNIKSLSDNFNGIINAAKINTEESAHRSVSSRMTEYYAMRNEMTARSALMIRAGDELLRLNNDLKEFLVLHDFGYLSQTIQRVEERAETEMNNRIVKYDNFRLHLNAIVTDVDREIGENFGLHN